MSQKQITTTMVIEANSLLEKLVECAEMTPEIESQLQHIDLTAPERVDLTVYLLERVKSEQAYWKERADYFTKIAKSFRLVEEKIRDGVKIAMVEGGHTDLHGIDMRWKLSEIEPRLEYEDDKLPAEFMMQVVSTKVNDEKLRNTLKNGDRVNGARLVPNYRLAPYANRKKISEAK
ncbi:MAG: siphovirus Gp157 family protein [Nitrosomonas sp.]|nr:siphovirus Gp157 family protein [Nitrosomonas sp.]